MRREKIAESPSVESEAAAVVEAAALCEHFVFVTYTKLKSPEVQQVTERVEQIKVIVTGDLWHCHSSDVQPERCVNPCTW